MKEPTVRQTTAVIKAVSEILKRKFPNLTAMDTIDLAGMIGASVIDALKDNE